MSKLLILIIAFWSLVAWPNAKWKQFYDLVNKDIKTVEALKTKDLSLRIRLFELYGEKLNLLLEKENDLRIKYLETGNKKQIDNILKIQKQTLFKLESIARKIERQTRNKKVLTKINYYRALNYYLVKDYNRFYKHIKMAERTNRDKKLGYLINSKLADYHYNDNRYAEAASYYKKLLYDTNNGWITRYYYNLAWSELKLKRMKSALAYIKKSHFFERKKGYVKIGTQLTDAIMLFHAFAGQTRQGLAYMQKYKIRGFDNHIKYLHYVFENGNRISTKYIIAHIEKMKKNADMEFRFLEKKVIVYRALKAFSLVQSNFGLFKRRLKKMNQASVKQESRSELKNSILSYTGYLQELVKSKRLISKKTKNKYVRYVAYNFNILRAIDPDNALEYSYFEGETYFSLRDFRRASYVYASGLRNYRKTKKGDKKYLSKSFDSLFKALEKQKKPSSKILLYSFNSYLALFPTGPKAAAVHQRKINFYQAQGDNRSMLSSLRVYNQQFPKDIKIQRDYYKQILNKYIDKKDINALNSLKKLVEKNFLRFTASETAKLNTIITQIYFSNYEKMATKGGTKEALEGFRSLFEDKKVSYTMRAEAIRKELYLLHEKFMYRELAPRVLVAMSFYNMSYKKKYGKELLFYTENICVGDLLDECIKLVQAVKKEKALQMSPALVNIFFKIYSSKTKNIEKAYALANTPDKKNFLFKILLAQDSSFKHPLYSKFYTIKNMRAIIDLEVERKYLNSFYDNLSFKRFKDFLSKISIKAVQDRYSKKIAAVTSSFKQANFNFTKAPNPQDISAEAFGNFGMTFNQDMTNILQKIGEEIGRIDPNFLPFFLSKIVLQFEKETKLFKKFIPISKDSALETAMNDELAKLHQFLDQKIIEYRQLYYEAVKNTSELAGARRYYDDIMKEVLRLRNGSVEIWQN